MSKQEKMCLIVMGIGIVIMLVASLDIISVLASLLNHLFNFSLPDVFLNTFVFRTTITLLGGAILIVGGLMYRCMNNKSSN